MLSYVKRIAISAQTKKQVQYYYCADKLKMIRTGKVLLAMAVSSLPQQRQDASWGLGSQLLRHHGLFTAPVNAVLKLTSVDFYSPLPERLPPNPPAPRMKTVCWFSKIILPLALSLVSAIRVTAAALPLSNTSRILYKIRSALFHCMYNLNCTVPGLRDDGSRGWDRCLDCQILLAMQKLGLEKNRISTKIISI